jgi:hypothetical protein
MSTLTIDYSLLGENRPIIESVVKNLRELGMVDSKIYGTLKSISATFKEVFDRAVQLVSDKPRSATDLFNEFIANADWQGRFSTAYQAVNTANAEIEAALEGVTSLATPRFEPVFSTGETPTIVAIKYVGKISKADQKEAFDKVIGLMDGVETAKLALQRVSRDAVMQLWPEGNNNATKDGEVVKSWKAIKVSQDEATNKWVAEGRASAPVDPNKPRTIGVARVGKTKVTVTYGETLVAEGGNKNDIYTRAGRFAVAAGLPGWTDPRFASFGRKNGQDVLVATDWPHTGLPKLQAAGFTVKEELVAAK